MDVATGVDSNVYTFTGGCGGGDGQSPLAPLISHGNYLFGTTGYGGGVSCPEYNSCGTVFEVDVRTGAETVLYRFHGGNDGDLPMAGLLYLDGVLYGTTPLGGGTGCEDARGCGTIFKTDLETGKTTVVYRFTGGADGSSPQGELIYEDGFLYGAASRGGQGYGTIFKIRP